MKKTVAKKPSMNGSQPSPFVQAMEFVRIWQQAESIGDVLKITGTNKAAAYNRAAHYRKLGIPLKKFSQYGQRLNVEALTSLAESLNGNGK